MENIDNCRLRLALCSFQTFTFEINFFKILFPGVSTIKQQEQRSRLGAYIGEPNCATVLAPTTPATHSNAAETSHVSISDLA